MPAPDRQDTASRASSRAASATSDGTSAGVSVRERIESVCRVCVTGKLLMSPDVLL